MATRDLTPEEREQLAAALAGVSEANVEQAAEEPVQKKKAVRRPFGYDPMDKRIMGTQRKILDESSQASLSNPNLTPIEDVLLSSYGAAVAANNVPEGFVPEPKTIPQEIAAGVGGGLGMMTDLGVAATLGAPSLVGFGLYGAAQPADSAGERMKNIGHNVLLDRFLRYFPPVLTKGIGKAAGKVVGRGVRTPAIESSATDAAVNVLRHPLGKLGYNQAVFSGLTELEGGSAKDEFWRNLGTSAAFSAPGGTGTPEPPRDIAGAPRRRNSGVSGSVKDAVRGARGSLLSVEQQNKARELAAEVREAKKSPIPGDRLSEVITPLTAGEATVNDMIGSAKNARIEGEYTAKRLAEITEDLTLQKSSGTFSGDIGREAERIAIEETLPSDWVGVVAEAKRLRDDIAEAEFRGDDTSKMPRGELNLGQSEFRSEFKFPTRQMQAMGGGEIGYKNVIDKYLVRPKEQVVEAKFIIQDALKSELIDIADRHGIKEGGRIDMAVGRVRELLKDGPLSDVINTKEFKDILDSVKSRDEYDRLMSATKDVAEVSDRWREMSNSIREPMGYSGADRLEGWFPKDRKKLGPFDIVGKVKRSWRGESGQADAGQASAEIKPSDKFFNPHEMRRTGRAMNDRDWSFVRNFDKYSKETAESITYSLGLAHDFAFARHLELSGFKSDANIINRYAQSDYNGRSWGASGWLDKALKGGGVPGVLGDFLMWNYSRLADAVFTANIAWNLFTQPLSRALTVGNAGVRNTIEGSLLSMAPELRDAMSESSHTSIIKGRKDGSVSRVGQEGVDSEPSGSFAKRGLYRRALDKMQASNRVIERDLDLEAGVAGLLDAKDRGLSGREMLDRASDVSSKSQSRYDRLYRPEALRSRTAKILVPFVGWKFETISNILEGAGLGAGNYKQNNTVASRAMYVARATSAMALAGMWAGLASREGYGPASVPALDIITSDGFTGGRLFPSVVYGSGVKAINAAAAGEFGDATKELVKSKVPLSRLVSNASDAALYSEGRGKFHLPEDQILLAIIVGVNNTPAGRAYYNKDGKKNSTNSGRRPR